jgi:hypothetical protein
MIGLDGVIHVLRGKRTGGWPPDPIFPTQHVDDLAVLVDLEAVLRALLH